jgi:hypothetical protein
MLLLLLLLLLHDDDDGFTIWSPFFSCTVRPQAQGKRRPGFPSDDRLLHVPHGARPLYFFKKKCNLYY